MRIAILEDDHDQQAIIGKTLHESGHKIFTFDNPIPFYRTIQTTSIDLLIFDWHLPTTNGLIILTHLRAGLGWGQPILFITSSNEENDIANTLLKGADDYLSKPIRPKELCARVSALARRSARSKHSPPPQTLETCKFGPYIFHPSSHAVELFGKQIPLTEKEYQLAFLLFQNTGNLLSRSNILEIIWAISSSVPTRTIDTHISRLRRKLHLNGTHGYRLKAVYQHGYRLESLLSLHDNIATNVPQVGGGAWCK